MVQLRCTRLLVINLLTILTLNCVFFASRSAQCQENLILNPSGEFSSNPTCCGTACYMKALNWWQLNPTYSTDYFCSQIPNSCQNSIPDNFTGFQGSKDGSFYFGIVTFDFNYDLNSCWRCRYDFVAGTFSQPLVKDRVYRFECWVSKAELGSLISNALDVFITYNLEVDVNNFSDDGYVIWSEATPMTDTLNWVKVSACFKARGGGERFCHGQLP